MFGVCLKRDQIQRRPDVSLRDSAVSFVAARVRSLRFLTRLRIVELVVLAFVAVAWFGWVGRGGFGNPYYSAAADTAGNDFRLFIVGGFDSGGFVTVDKPPAGLWLPAIVGRVFGGGATSFVAANAVLTFAGAVAVGATTARRWRVATVLLVLSTPGFAVLARTTLPDATMLAAACAGAAALFNARSVRGFVLAGVLFGLAVLAKPAAVLMLPAVAVWLWRSEASRRGGLAVVGAGLGVLVLWMLVVSAVDVQPWLGGTADDQVWQQLFGGGSLSRQADTDLRVLDAVQGAASAGDPGVFRVVSGRMGRQAGFLIPFAFIAGAAAWRVVSPVRRLVVEFWGLWLVMHVAVFSTLPGIAHAYYAAALAPAIAALTVEALNTADRTILLATVGAAGSLFVSLSLFDTTPFPGWIAAVALAVAVTAAIGVLVAGGDPVVLVYAAVSVSVFLAAVIATDSLLVRREADFDPAAGETVVLRATDLSPVAAVVGGSGARWDVATADETLASRLAIEHGVEVMLVGGFLGTDPILTPTRLQDMLTSGQVAFLDVPQLVRTPADAMLAVVAETCEPPVDVLTARITTCQ